MTDPPNDDRQTVLILNPDSGDETHPQIVRDRAAHHDYEVRETEYGGHAVELAREAATEEVDELVAVGGDGTVNELLQGVLAADALREVTLGVIPAGTGNDFAANIGVTGIEQGFDVVETGERRELDLGLADGRPFINSCVAGITAEASHETSSTLKSQFGVLAYVFTTLRLASEFDGVEITATVDDGDGKTTVWEGTAAIVIVGNGRRFTTAGSEQANVEDGLLDVMIHEDAGSIDAARDRLYERVFGTEGENLHRFLTSSLDLRVDGDRSAKISLDGDILDLSAVEIRTEPRSVTVCVGDGYQRPEELS